MFKKHVLLVLLIVGILSGCFKSPNYSHQSSKRHYQVNDEEKGLASWYGKQFQHKRTSSGERFNMNSDTAAHKYLPLQSKIQVTNLRNGRSVIVRVNDRGPFIRNRIVDLSYGAAKKIGMLGHGTAPVRIKVIRLG
jgi:rare lipoprotein A